MILDPNKTTLAGNEYRPDRFLSCSTYLDCRSNILILTAGDLHCIIHYILPINSSATLINNAITLLAFQSDVNNVNGFIDEDPSLAGLSLWKLMKQTDGSIFNNVAQVNRYAGGVRCG